MKHYNIYPTGLIPIILTRSEWPPGDPLGPYKGKNWIATLERHDGDVQTKRKTFEIHIHARSRERAQQALELIVCAHTVWGDVPTFDLGNVCARSDEHYESVDLSKRNNYYKKRWDEGLAIACAIAAKASFRRYNIYALAKYHLSATLWSCDAVGLDPQHPHYLGHLPIAKSDSEQIKFSYSIISAYSALEDLGFEVRANKKNPSMIKDDWNPKVKAELESRLRKKRINLSERQLWAIRGPIRKTQNRGLLENPEKLPWAKGMVRDGLMELVDTISRASFLRSKVSSHKTTELARSLSPYDVVNTQSLARRLILESLGYRRYFDKQKLIDTNS